MRHSQSTGVPSVQANVPSTAASFRPIQQLPVSLTALQASITSRWSASVCMLARCPPLATQASSAEV